MICPKCGEEMKADDDYFTGEDYYYCPKCGYETDYIGK